jgi:hypothetical protein
LEDVSRNLKVEQQRFASQEQQIRSREGELSQAMQVEESRWSELISRLEQAIKKYLGDGSPKAAPHRPGITAFTEFTAPRTSGQDWFNRCAAHL